MSAAMQSVKLSCTVCGQLNRVATERLSAGPRCGACGEPLLDGKVSELDAKAHDKAVRGDTLPLLIDYWAPWCGPCRMMAPAFAKAAVQLRVQARLMKLNTQDHPTISARLGIRGIPLLILYREGRELGRLAGARPLEDIVDFVKRHIS